MAEFDSVIPAGGSGQLTAKVATKAGTNGRFSKSIAVQTDAPGFENVRLKVNFNVVTPIVVTPAHRIFINTLEGTPAKERVLLHRADGNPLEVQVESATLTDGITITTATVHADEVDARFPNAAPGDVWLSVNAEGVSTAYNHSGSVVLATNDPAQPRLDVPLIVRVRPIIDVRPSPVRLWPSDGGPDGTSALVRLGHGGRLKFEITGVEVADPELITADVLSQGLQQIHSLRVTLAEGVMPQDETLRTSVRIATSDASRPSIELPVEISPRNQVVRRHLRPVLPQGGANGPSRDGEH